MSSSNYFQHASRPCMPDTPRLSGSSFYSDQFEKHSDLYYPQSYPQHAGYHGLGIRGIHTSTSSVAEQLRLSTPPLVPDHVEDEEHDQFKIPTPVDEDMMTMAHDRSRHRRAASRELRENNQALKQLMFAASDLTSDDRKSRRSIMSPRSMSYQSLTEISASRSPEELRDSQDFWKICLMVRKMMARGDREAERQKLLTTPHCCSSCGTPMTPVVFTPSRSFEVVGAWKETQVLP